jgi:geranylgeranyl pyrophosphate synthase
MSAISGSHGGECEDVFWNFAPFSLVEVYRRFRMLTASIISAINLLIALMMGGSKHS